MVILIPSIIIFLAFAYLQLNEEVSFFEELSVYFIIILTLGVSLKLYKAIKKDIKTQEQNALLLEIKNLESKLQKEEDEKQKEFISRKIEKIKKEL